MLVEKVTSTDMLTPVRHDRRVARFKGSVVHTSIMLKEKLKLVGMEVKMVKLGNDEAQIDFLLLAQD